METLAENEEKEVQQKVAISILCFASTLNLSAGAQGKSSYVSDWSARHSPFSINDQEFGESSGMAADTPTSHHRFGAVTGIGSSSFQTQSATAEDMPRQNYEPTSISPSLPKRDANPALAEIRFSGRASSESPAFSSVLQKPQSFEVESQGFSSITSPFSFDLRFNRRQSSGLGGGLTDPLNRL